MLLNVYSIYDVKTLTYSPPFFQPAHGAAVRLFSDLVQDSNTSVGRHPADYALFCIGNFDDARGELQPAPQREHIVDAVSLLPRQQPELFANSNGSALAK